MNKKHHIKMANGSSFNLIDDPNTKSLSPIYSIDSLHCYIGENYFTHDRKYKICHYNKCGYWEVSEIGSCNINDFITRELTLQKCIDFLNISNNDPNTKSLSLIPDQDDNFISNLQEIYPTPDDFYREFCNVPDMQYSKLNDLVVTQAADASKKRSDQIREKLREHGFQFETDSDGELFNFLSTRCKIEYYEATKLMALYADGRFICQWYDTFDIQTEFDPKNPLTIKSTITCGNPPKI